MWFHLLLSFVLIYQVTSKSPVIGILAQPIAPFEDESLLYIAASYVKWVEAGGGRSLPIPYDAVDTEQLDLLFQQIDAILLPGGATPDLSFAVRYMIQRAIDSNAEGNFFPIWGTCLGMEYLVEFVGGSDILENGFESENVSLALEEVLPSKLYGDDHILGIVTRQNVTLNNHRKGLQPSDYWNSAELQAVWHITSVNHDGNGRPFVSTLEPVDEDHIPFYAVQYHPEKNAFEYATYSGTNIPFEAINHSEDAVDFSIALARFMVGLARRTTGHEYTEVLRVPCVYTYPLKAGIQFEQFYVLPATGRRSPVDETDEMIAQF